MQQVKTRGGSPSLVGSYTYDAFGRRTSKYVASSGSTTVYFYNDQQVIEEYNGSGGTAAYYTYGDGIDERITMHRGGTDYYYHANRLGSIYLLTNGTGGILERYAYTPYGVVTVSNSAYASSGTVSSVGNPYLFTGREFDPESGLYNYRARTYDPVQGRFKQLDPIGYAAGDYNLYQYVGDEPTYATDPSGLAQQIADCKTPGASKDRCVYIFTWEKKRGLVRRTPVERGDLALGLIPCFSDIPELVYPLTTIRSTDFMVRESALTSTKVASLLRAR